ncbi:hypothetical protein ACH9L7_05255 [Haloferax sp. S1W]|uniref:hypothetical protein n=1 Tax=Haloferax sp. S1W TaxID=3377110 RepID=UPI0037CB0E8C
MADADWLEVWTVSTFNVVALGLVGVTAGHTTGALTDSLPNFGTLPGVVTFIYLWALTVLATRWALSEGGLDRIHEGELATLVGRGAIAGAGIGAGFLLGAVLVGSAVAVVRFVLEQGTTGGFQVLPFLLIILVGVGIAALVGALVGGVFVVLDAACYWVAGRFVRLDAGGE